MQIPILSGIYADNQNDFRTSYPRNLIPITKNTGIAKGYLRPADGIVLFGEGPGKDRGGINWNGVCYRAMGTKLVAIAANGNYVDLGEIGGSTQVTMDYSFDYLAIASNGNLFLYRPSTGLAQVTSPNIGLVLDVVWVGGYFMTTDGTNLVVTNLNDPFTVDPLKYGSSELSPDAIICLLELRGEIYALNRLTTEIFKNVGGTKFPFQVVEGAQAQRGCIGVNAATIFMEQIAFLGNGFNEQPALYFLNNGVTNKASTEDIDIIFQSYTEEQLALTIVEGRIGRGYQHLWVRLPDRTFVFDYGSSQVTKELVWFELTSGTGDIGAYRAKNLVWCYDKWIVGDCESNKYGYLTSDISSQYGDVASWEFGTQIIYNESVGANFNQIELVGLPGRVLFGTTPTIETSYSYDGQSWSMPKVINAGKQGNFTKRLVWLQQGTMQNYRMQRFRGTSDAFMSFSRLEVKIEPLNA